MRVKRIVRNMGVIVIVILVIIGAIIFGVYIASERKQRMEYYSSGYVSDDYDEERANEERTNEERTNEERTNEEYMAVLTDNREDFEYVARTMQQWDSGYIDFYDEYGRRMDFENATSNNPEIEAEISNNTDFYNSLKNLYELDEVHDIVIAGKYGIEFGFSKFPQNYHGGVAYGSTVRSGLPIIPIDEDWVLEMIPNT